MFKEITNDNFDVKTCHVIPAIINRMLGGENPFTAWGSPDVVRDFLTANYLWLSL